MGTVKPLLIFPDPVSIERNRLMSKKDINPIRMPADREIDTNRDRPESIRIAIVNSGLSIHRYFIIYPYLRSLWLYTQPLLLPRGLQ